MNAIPGNERERNALMMKELHRELDVLAPHLLSKVMPGPSQKLHDKLQRFPAEIRKKIFAFALSAGPFAIYRGASNFGPLNERNLIHKAGIAWQILTTCRTYYLEAAPIMYKANRLVFCTGKSGDPGTFWRFPIKVRYMQFVTDLGIYMLCDSPKSESAKRVAHFITALSHRAVKLEHLTIMLSASSAPKKKVIWDILFYDHPVAKAIVTLVEAKTVTHLRIRLNDNACLYNGFAGLLLQIFHKDDFQTERSLIFTCSCTCRDIVSTWPNPYCADCNWPFAYIFNKPIEALVHPRFVEADEQRTMDTQANLFEAKLLPLKDDDEEDVDNTNVGPYGGGPPIEDDYEENRKAFTMGLLLPGQVHRYRDNIVAPKVWSFEQIKITKYFRPVEDDRELLNPVLQPVCRHADAGQLA